MNNNNFKRNSLIKNLNNTSKINVDSILRSFNIRLKWDYDYNNNLMLIIIECEQT